MLKRYYKYVFVYLFTRLLVAYRDKIWLGDIYNQRIYGYQNMKSYRSFAELLSDYHPWTEKNFTTEGYMLAAGGIYLNIDSQWNRITEDSDMRV